MSASLRYTDAEDKCYGIAGMTIALVVYDCEGYIDNISLERADLDSVAFTPEFIGSLTQGASARSAWKSSLNRLRISTAMLISNVMCRHYVRRFRNVDRELVDLMRDIVRDEADNLCQLENDEADRLFVREYNELDEAFRSRSIHEAASRLVGRLKQQPSLSLIEIMELMQ